jgi:hypothetical protein
MNLIYSGQQFYYNPTFWDFKRFKAKLTNQDREDEVTSVELVFYVKEGLAHHDVSESTEMMILFNFKSFLGTEQKLIHSSGASTFGIATLCIVKLSITNLGMMAFITETFIKMT